MKIPLFALLAMIVVLSEMVALNPFGHDLVDVQATASIGQR